MARIADRAIRGEPLLEHPKQHRDFPVHIVIDSHLGLGRMMSMEPAAVLNQRPFPRDRQGEEECVESGIIEAFTDVAARRHYEPLRRIRNRRELIGRTLPLLYRHPASQYHHMAHEATKTFSEVFQVILSFCEQ